MLYLGIIAAIFSLEFVIKTIVEKKGKTGVTKSVCNGKILLKKHHNRGFALNKGQKRPQVVAFVSFLLCLGITLFALFAGGKYNRVVKTGLSMILGGAYSNTYDRLFRNYVVDYVSIGVKNRKLCRVIFNIADFCIMIGAILVIMGGIGHENIGKGQICRESDGGLGGSQ